MSDLDQPTPQQWATQALRHMRKICDLEISNAELTTRVAELEAKAADVVAELRRCERDSRLKFVAGRRANPCLAAAEVTYGQAASLVAEKLGVK